MKNQPRGRAMKELCGRRRTASHVVPPLAGLLNIHPWVTPIFHHPKNRN